MAWESAEKVQKNDAGQFRAFIGGDWVPVEKAQKNEAGQYRVMRAASVPQDDFSPTNGMSGTDKFLSGAGKALTDIGRGVGQMVGLTSQKDIDEAKARDAALMNTGAGMAGNVVGNVAATLPAAFIPGANTVVGSAVIGGALGAAQPVATGESRLENAAIGGAGGAAGQVLGNAVGRAIRPVQSQLSEPVAGLAAKAEQVYGIPLNAAQKTGSRPLKIIDSVLDNMPLTADRQALAKELQRNAFNKATLATVGETAEKATPDVLNAARTRIGDSFNALSDRNAVRLGNDFINALAKVESGVNEFSNPGIRTTIDKALDLASRGNIDGRTYQNVRSTLGKQAQGAFSSGNAELGQALKSVKSALDSAADQSVSAADKEAWQTARSQWQNLKVLEKAAAPNSADAVAGNVSPAKLAQALLSVDRKGMTYGTRGDDLSDLARIGQALLKNSVPDSGTAQRSFYQRMLENPLTAAWQTGVGGVSLPVQAVMNSKMGQKYLGQGPVDPKTLKLAQMLKQAAGSGGAALPIALNAE